MVINAKTTFKSGTQNISDILANIDNTASTANTNAQNAQNVANQAQVEIDALDASVKPITDAIKGSTEIDGGLVTTNVLMVKDSKNAISGGISGLPSDSIAFWSGGSLADAINGNCNVIIRKDGTAKIGSFIISKDKAQIILADGNYATMSAGGIEVTLANGGKATYNSSGVSIIDSNNEEKIKLINGDVSLGYFSDDYEISNSYLDSSTKETLANMSDVIIPIKGNNSVVGWNCTNPKNTRTYELTYGGLIFSLTYSSPSSNYITYFNVKVALIEGDKGLVVRTFKEYAVKISYLNGYRYQVLENQEVNVNNSDSLNWGDIWTGNSTVLNSSKVTIKDTSNNISVGRWEMALVINRFTKNTYGELVSSPPSSTYKIEWSNASYYIKLIEYRPKTLIGTNGFVNFNSIDKYFGAYLDSSNEYHIKGRGIVDIQNVVSTTNEEE